MDILENGLKELYKIDSTLGSLKRFEKIKEELLKLKVNTQIRKDKSDELKQILQDNSLSKAFKNNDAYNEYSGYLLDSLNSKTLPNITLSLSKSISSYLNIEYEQALKATDLFSNSLIKSKGLNPDRQIYYNDKLSEAIKKYQNNKLKGSQNILSLASEINKDLFKLSIDKHNIGLGSFKDSFTNLSPSAKKLATLNSSIIKHNIDKVIIKDFKSLNSEIRNSLNQIKPPRINNSSVYKQNAKLLSKSDKQIEVMQKMSEYINISSKNLEIQAEKSNNQNERIIMNSNAQIKVMEKISKLTITSIKNQDKIAIKLSEENDKLLKSSKEQIKLMAISTSFMASQSEILDSQILNQELQNEHLSNQNKIMEKQIDANVSSSNRALLLAWAGIGIAVVSSIAGICSEYIIFKEEDKSDTLNHMTLVQAINTSSEKNVSIKILKELKKQNKNLNLLNLNLEKQIMELNKLKVKNLEKYNKTYRL